MNWIWSLELASTVMCLFPAGEEQTTTCTQVYILSVWLIENQNLIHLLDVRFPYTCRPKYWSFNNVFLVQCNAQPCACAPPSQFMTSPAATFQCM